MTKQNSQSRYISTITASKILGISRQSVAGLLRRGKLRGERFEHQWIVERASVMEYLEERRSKLETQLHRMEKVSDGEKLTDQES